MGMQTTFTVLPLQWAEFLQLYCNYDAFHNLTKQLLFNNY